MRVTIRDAMLNRCCPLTRKIPGDKIVLACRVVMWHLILIDWPEIIVTWQSFHLFLMSPWVGMGTTELTKQGYDLRSEASGVKKRRRKEQKKWWNYKLTSTLTTLFLRFVHSDAPERSGRGDTFSSAKTPLVIHIKTEGRAAEVETEKSHWCGTNSFGGFSFFLH